jgi:hypothetical protein
MLQTRPAAVRADRPVGNQVRNLERDVRRRILGTIKSLRVPSLITPFRLALGLDDVSPEILPEVGQRRFDEDPISSIELPLLFAPSIHLTPSLHPRVFFVLTVWTVR